MAVSETEKLVCQEYNRLAPIYDLRWRKYIDRSLTLLLNFAEIPPEATILDLACPKGYRSAYGTGELTKLILEKNPQQVINGVDITPAMLDIAQKKLKDYSQVKLINASATELPFKSQSFDLIVCANAFHYFDLPQLALAEIKRVLKLNGRVIILDWCRDYWVLKLLNFWFKAIDPGYQRSYTQSELEQLLQDGGFNVEKHNRVRFGSIWELIAIEVINS